MNKKVNKYCAGIAAFLILEMLLFSINFSGFAELIDGSGETSEEVLTEDLEDMIHKYKNLFRITQI